MTTHVSVHPRGAQVAHFLERLAALTPAQWDAMRGTLAPLQRPMVGRLRSAAAFVRAVLVAGPGAGHPRDVDAVCAAVENAIERGVVPGEERDLVIHAGLAVLLEDVLPPAEATQWYGPFESVIPRASL